MVEWPTGVKPLSVTGQSLLGHGQKGSRPELAGLNEDDYTHIYRLHFQDKMDVSIFPDPPPSKLPQAPRRLRYISSYRSSLRSLKSVGYIVLRLVGAVSPNITGLKGT